MRKITITFLLMLSLGLLLCSCRNKEERDEQYRYIAAGDVIFALPRNGGALRVLYDSQEGLLSAPVTRYNTKTGYFYGGTVQGHTGYYTDSEALAVLPRPLGDCAVYSDEEGVHLLTENRAVLLFPAGEAVDCDGEAILFRVNDSYSVYENETVTPLGEYADGWLTVSVGDRKREGVAAILIDKEGKAHLYEKGIFTKAREELGSLCYIRHSLAAVYRYTDGDNYLCNPFGTWEGTLRIPEGVDILWGGVLDLPLSPDGCYLLADDTEFIYRLGIFTDDLGAVWNDLYHDSDGAYPFDSALLTNSGRALFTQAPDTVTEFESPFYLFSFSKEEEEEE